MNVVNTPSVEKIQMCITSGSCTNVKIWKQLGGFDDWLFIDLVDNDYCKRVVLSGYEILKLNNVILNHQYGDILPRSKYVERFFLKIGSHLQCENIAKLSFVRNVNPLRVYYENRNVIYLNKKYKKYGGIGYENHHCKTYLGFMIVFSLYSFLIGREKTKILGAIFHGVKDGLNKEVLAWRVNEL